MDNNFTTAMKFVGQWEWGNRPDGGYTNDPADPGGETKWGVSKKAHPNVNIKDLTLEGAMDIYWKDYWVPSGCLDLPLDVAVVRFDSAVNCGVSRAKGFGDTVKDIIDRRRAYYAGLVQKKPALNKFFKGWINRTVDLKKFVELLPTS